MYLASVCPPVGRNGKHKLCPLKQTLQLKEINWSTPIWKYWLLRLANNTKFENTLTNVKKKKASPSTKAVFQVAHIKPTRYRHYSRHFWQRVHFFFLFLQKEAQLCDCSTKVNQDSVNHVQDPYMKRVPPCRWSLFVIFKKTCKHTCIWEPVMPQSLLNPFQRISPTHDSNHLDDLHSTR